MWVHRVMRFSIHSIYISLAILHTREPGLANALCCAAQPSYNTDRMAPSTLYTQLLSTCLPRTQLIGAFVAISVVFIASHIAFALFLSPFRHVPGPLLCKMTRFYLRYQDIRLQRNQKIYEWHLKYGSVVQIAPGEVSFSNPHVAKEIYSVSAKYPKSSYFDNLAMYGYRSVFMARDARHHQKLRKRTFRCYQASTIHKPATLEYVRTRARNASRELGKTTDASGGSVNVFLPCNTYSFDNVTRFALGPDLCTNAISNTPESQKMVKGWEECEVWAPMNFNLPKIIATVKFIVKIVTGNKSFLEGDNTLQKWTTSQLTTAMRRPLEEDRDSLVQQLLRVKGDDDAALSRDEIAEELLDNFFAAQSVVTNALVFLLWDFARFPEWQDKVRRELMSLPRQADGLPSYADIEALPILDACLQESSRVHPLASGRAERVMPVAKAYDEIMIPSGVSVGYRAMIHCVIADDKNRPSFPRPLSHSITTAMHSPNQPCLILHDGLTLMKRSWRR